MWRFRVFVFSLLLAAPQRPPTASGAEAEHSITIPRIERPLVLADLLHGDPVLKHVKMVTAFMQREPYEGRPPSQKTTAYLAFDDRHLYVGFVCLDDSPRLVRGNIIGRDSPLMDEEDFVEVVVDTYFDRRRAYGFIVNPRGIQYDYSIPHTSDEDNTFDTLWQSQGAKTDDGYAALLSIPFKSLRFSSQREQRWGILLARTIPRNREVITWPPMRRSSGNMLGQEGEALGLSGIHPGRNLQFIPYGAFSSERFLDARNGSFAPARQEGRLGIDAKWVMGSNLTLDATVNPDFSQVESDEPQITSNQRFEVFFPERRPFFMENSSYFSTPVRALFTRRIADPQFGLKVSGKIDRYTVAALVADDRSPGERVAADDPLSGSRAYFAFARIYRDVGRQSGIGVLWSSRQFQSSSNYVAGPDANWRITRATSLGVQFLKSFTRDCEGVDREGIAVHAALSHISRYWEYSLQYNDRSPQFDAAAGFVPRVDYRAVEAKARHIVRTDGTRILNWGPSLDGAVFLDHSGRVQEWVIEPGFKIEFARATELLGHCLHSRERFGGFEFSKGQCGVEFSTKGASWVSSSAAYDRGSEINYTPQRGLSPFVGRSELATLSVTLRPTARLAWRGSLLRNGLQTRGGGRNVFNNNIMRSKWNYQFTPRLSVRAIAQYANVLPSEQFSSMEYAKTLTGDVLLTYLVHPGTALYIGYSNMLENYERQAWGSRRVLERSRADMISTASGLFVRLSFLARL